MALRPIDNALPISSERLKRQAKTIISAHKEKQVVDIGVNDENIAPLPYQSSTEVSIDYISSENLKPIQDPDFKIQALVGGLESKDWLKVCESLNDVRRFALYHSDLLLSFLDKVVLVMVKSMKNPRSALIKTSIMASYDIFKAFGVTLYDSTSDSINQLILQLLLKACQDKKFVCEEAERALLAMVEAMAPLPLLQKLSAYVGHSNLKVRAKAAIFISKCVSKMMMDVKGMEEFGLTVLIQTASNLLNDKLPEAREAARSIVVSLYEAITESREDKQEYWQSLCQSNLPAINAQAMLKIVSST
ncbi:hypothetical protein CASFOL_030065 [Castilleja foliolosa]|uniref:TOG domain-containing protein n=1 Tax=Castilleja foliolosa TaxID=1961234 RepID=A0ABD3CBR2_9LAMI